MTTEERLEKLERQLARANRRNRRMVLAGAGLLLALFALLALGKDGPRLNLFDGNSRFRTMLAVGKNGPMLVLDEDDQLRAMLHMDKAGLLLRLYDASGTRCAWLRVGHGPQEILLRDENGKLLWSP